VLPLNKLFEAGCGIIRDVRVQRTSAVLLLNKFLEVGYSSL
jgi:hypothetical protein